METETTLAVQPEAVAGRLRRKTRCMFKDEDGRWWLDYYTPDGKRRRKLVGTVNDICALAALRAFEEAGVGPLCAVVGQNAIREARNELRRPGTRLIGTVAYFPERYGDELLPLALNLLERKPVPPATFVKHQLLTPKNVDLIYPLDRPGNMPSAGLKDRAT